MPVPQNFDCPTYIPYNIWNVCSADEQWYTFQAVSMKQIMARYCTSGPEASFSSSAWYEA